MGQPPTGQILSDPRDLVDIAWRRKWILVVPLAVFVAAAVFLAYALPNVYRSSTVILVEKPKVPEEYVKSTVTTRIEDRLATITQQILSRTRLESIINQFDLYREERATLPMDAVVERMRRAIEVQVRGNDAFTVFYRGRDPAVVRDVTNRLAALFIEENSKVREEQAAGTSQFLETQLAALKQTLTEQERQVRDFKERYMGELPQQQEANLRALDRLQLQSRAIADQLRAAEDRRALLQTQLADMPRAKTQVERVARRVPAGQSPAPQASPTSAAPLGVVAAQERDPALARLEEARANLAQLQARYTDLHPDVQRAKRHLEELESLVGSRTLSVTTAAPVPPVSSGLTGDTPEGSARDRVVIVEELREVPNPAYRQLEAQLAATEKEIEELRGSQGEITLQIRALQRRVENVPKLEQQLMELTRDYDNTRRTYESLLSKKLEAQLAENLEKRQKGEQFRVLDPAALPQTPYKPSRRLILALGLAFGLGTGIAGVVGLELLDSSIRNPRQLKTLAPRLPVVGTVPVIHDPQQAWRRRVASTAVGVLVLFVATTAMAGAVHYKDEIVRLRVFEFFLR